MHHVLDWPNPAIREWLVARNQPGYRAAQIAQALCQGRVGTFAEITELPLTLRDALAVDFQIWTAQVVRHRQAADGTEKLLLQWPDGGRIDGGPVP